MEEIKKIDLSKLTIPKIDERVVNEMLSNPLQRMVHPIIKEPEIDWENTPGARLERIENNQKEEIEKLKVLITKKDEEIEALKIQSKKDRKRFWITYGITTGIAVVGIILGIIF